MKNSDPNNQRHHTFGDSLAAERLVKEIDKGLKYKAAIRILHRGINLAVELDRHPVGGKDHFLNFLRDNIIDHLDRCTSDKIVKSLCKNVFVAKIRSLRRKNG